MRHAVDEKQVEIYRQMTPTRKWQTSVSLYWSARVLKTAFLRQQHPEWTERMIRDEVNRLFAREHE